MASVQKDYPFSDYNVQQKLSQQELQFVEEFIAVINRTSKLSDFCEKYNQNQAMLKNFLDSLDVSKLNMPLPRKEKRLFEQTLANALQVPNKFEIAEAVANRVHGFVLIQPLFEDEELEEIIINGTSPVFVYHRTFNECKTNLSFTKNQLEVLLAQMEVNKEKSIHDLKLVDWHRANAILPPLVESPAITIRKFRAYPFSIIDLLNKNTINAEAAAYLWAAVDGLQANPLNFLIIGGTSAGKTTTLNTLSAFIPPWERIVTIEDTPELNLFQKQNWVQTLSTDEYPMQELLTNVLRMRPDRIIVGDIRSGEAETLFTAMNTGHRGVMGTLHANNAKDMAMRLENEPMNVPKSLIPLADFVVVQHRVNDRRKGLIRRVMQISEVTKIEEGVIAMNDVFLYDFHSDTLERTKFQSAAVENLANYSGKTINEVKDEVAHRAEILALLQQKGVRRFEDVNSFLWKYYEQYSMNSRQEPDAEEQTERAPSENQGLGDTQIL
ncbi:TPA: CpaF family protein [Candidatus Micrarchaeota archaeon]|nr:CpaF family protein [Candidatus Micrarchaeota archaeon]